MSDEVIKTRRVLSDDEMVKQERLVAIVSGLFARREVDFVTIGTTTVELREMGTWEATHDSFEEFCRDRFGKSYRTVCASFQVRDIKKAISDVRQHAAGGLDVGFEAFMDASSARTVLELGKATPEVGAVVVGEAVEAGVKVLTAPEVAVAVARISRKRKPAVVDVAVELSSPAAVTAAPAAGSAAQSPVGDTVNPITVGLASAVPVVVRVSATEGSLRVQWAVELMREFWRENVKVLNVIPPPVPSLVFGMLKTAFEKSGGVISVVKKPSVEVAKAGTGVGDGKGGGLAGYGAGGVQLSAYIG